MKAIKFPQMNCTYAKDQEEYKQLPAHRTTEGEVTSCWRLTGWERLKVLIFGVVYLRQLTFNNPLQPVLIMTESNIEVKEITIEK